MKTEHLSLEMIGLLSNKDNNCYDGSAEFDITGRSQIHLEAAIAMFMCKLNKAESILIKEHEIIFNQYPDYKNSYFDDKNINAFTKLPFALDAKGVIDFVNNWFRQLDESKLPKQPDHDGSNSPGWRVQSDSYGQNLKVSFWWLEHHK